MNYILKDTAKMNEFTDIRVIFQALDGFQRNNNWLIEDMVSLNWVTIMAKLKD